MSHSDPSEDVRSLNSRCHPVRDAQRPLGGRRRSRGGQGITQGGRHPAHQVPTPVHRQANTMARYPPLRTSWDGKEFPSQGGRDRGQEHLLQCQFVGPRQQVDGREREVSPSVDFVCQTALTVPHTGSSSNCSRWLARTSPPSSLSTRLIRCVEQEERESPRHRDESRPSSSYK